MKINAKQLLAIAVCGLALAGCGGGGGRRNAFNR
jgi:predicted small lipoprotein YifL